jgi:hypothetical protein
MFDIKDQRRQAIAKFEAIKKINEMKDPGDFLSSLDNDVKDFAKNSGKNLQSFLDKNKQKIPNFNNIFGDLTRDLDKILGIDHTKGESKLKIATRESVNETVFFIKQIIVDNIKKALFANDGQYGCGVNTLMPVNDIYLYPSEFDFLSALKIDPTTTMGQIVYEGSRNIDNKIKMNRELYNEFNSSNPYVFISIINNDLFTINWIGADQRYHVTGLQSLGATVTIDQFITQYYESIEMPTTSDVLKNCVALMLAGDGSQPKEFDIKVNDIMRVITRIMSYCGQSTKDSNLQQTPKDQFEENEVDPSFYFDFDDVDGIDLDDESLRYKRVLRFTDCNNFEVPINANHLQDFAYLVDKKDPVDAFNSTLSKVAKDAYDASGQSMPLDNFQASINSLSIQALPKALLLSVFSPKMFLPFAVLYKALNATIKDTIVIAKKVIQHFSKIIFGILHDLFFKFITIFWKKVKPQLLAIILDLIPRVLKKAKKRYINIIKGLIRILSFAIPFIGIKNCKDLFDQIIKLLEALQVGLKTKIPGFLCNLAKYQPGHSVDRALGNAAQYMEANGIPVGPIYGEDNNVLTFVSSILQGHQDEVDQNSYVEISLNNTSIPVAPGGGAALVTNLLKGYGKIR